MRVQIPYDDFQTKKQLHTWLLSNKKALIAKKCLGVIGSDSLGVTPKYIQEHSLNGEKAINPTGGTPVLEDVDVLRVRTVANSTYVLDSHMDVLVPGTYTKTLKERKSLIPHIHDHIHRTDAEIGKVIDITVEDISAMELGFTNVRGTAESLVFTTDIMRSMNEKVFDRYKDGRANQHSIGLQYVKLDLAIHDEESEKEMEFWNEHFPKILNPEIAEERGFFWVVQEIKLIENSVVLFGSNPATPTLDNNVKSEPEQSTQQKEPSCDTLAIIQSKVFFND